MPVTVSVTAPPARLPPGDRAPGAGGCPPGRAAETGVFGGLTIVPGTMPERRSPVEEPEIDGQAGITPGRRATEAHAWKRVAFTVR